MNRQLLRVPVQLGFFYPFVKSQNKNDTVTFEGSVTAEQYAKVDPMKKTGMEGLKRMWEYDEVRGYSDELQVSIQAGFYSGFIGGAFMGVKDGKNSFAKWMRTNLSSKFVNEADAKKYLSDAVTVGVFKGFMKEGFKIGLFVTAYLLTSNSVSVYRGKTGVLDFVIGGAFAGGAFRFWHGPRGFVIGIGVGSIVGLTGGGLYLLILKCLGTTYEEVKDYQMNLITTRERAYKQGQKGGPWEENAQNAMLQHRTAYIEEKDMFQEDPKQ